MIVYFFIAISSALSRDTIPDLDLLVRKEYPEYVDELYRLIDKINLSDAEEALRYCEKLRRAAIAAGSKEWKLEADFIETEYLKQRSLEGKDVTLAKYAVLLEDSRDFDNGIFRIHVLWGYFHLLWSLRDYEQAFHVSRQFRELLETVSYEDFFRKPYYLYRAGEAYYYFHDYDGAMEVLRPVDKMPLDPHTLFSKLHSANTIGLIHQQRGDLDSSDYYFRRVYGLGVAEGDSVWIGIASGNLGKNAFLRKDYETAAPMLKLDYDLAIKNRDYGLAAGSGIVLADILLHRDRPDMAKSYLDSSFSFIRRSKQFHRLRFLYPVMAKYEAEMGDPKVAGALLDSADKYRNIYQSEFNSILLMRVKQNVHRAELDAIKAAEARQNLLWNVRIIVVSLLAVALSVVLYLSRQQSRMRRKISEMERDRQARELAEAREQLDAFAAQIVREKALLENVRKEMNSKKNGTLEELRKSRILTEEDWTRFQDQFNAVYSDFSNNLRSQYYQLTQSEVRFLSLTKLGLSLSQIASAQGVSAGSPRVTWHRIRKKLKCPKGTTPESFIHSVTKGDH